MQFPDAPPRFDDVGMGFPLYSNVVQWAAETESRYAWACGIQYHTHSMSRVKVLEETGPLVETLRQKGTFP